MTECMRWCRNDWKKWLDERMTERTNERTKTDSVIRAVAVSLTASNTTGFMIRLIRRLDNPPRTGQVFTQQNDDHKETLQPQLQSLSFRPHTPSPHFAPELFPWRQLWRCVSQPVFSLALSVSLWLTWRTTWPGHVVQKSTPLADLSQWWHLLKSRGYIWTVSREK